MGIARPLLAAALLASLAGCGAGIRRADNDFEEWTHPTKDALEIRNERAECARFHGSSQREIDRCLEAKGWKRRDG